MRLAASGRLFHCMRSRMRPKPSRRDFIQATTATAALAISGCARDTPPPAVPGSSAPRLSSGTPPPRSGAIPRRSFARSPIGVSVIGIGGWHLGDAPDEKEAVRIVHEAIDAGVNFFDNAWEYHDGKSEEIL